MNDVTTSASIGTQATDSSSRIPIYAIWHEDVGPMLSLGMLTAAARNWRDGALNEHFEIRKPETGQSFLADLAKNDGPAILLCSNYVWMFQQNLETAAAGRNLNEELLILHGGPSTPKYEADAARFLDEHDRVADILVRGEGEQTLCELLDLFAAAGGLRPEPDRLAEVAGITFTDGDEVIRTAERSRLADLDALPSPYLTGEFDGIHPDAWKYCLSIETNRGCPYSCTFCDWGSATMSRIRKFDVDRVVAEFRWAAELGVATVTITDANFGIVKRDVDISTGFAEAYSEFGAPQSLSWTTAKNTTKHLIRIMDVLSKCGIAVSTSLSLQTIDETTLDIIKRSNISTDHYVQLAASYRARGFPLVGDLMLGLPGQTFESYRDDVQFMLDHEILIRTWPVQLLPNAPMNAPEYREEHGIKVGPDNLVTSSKTFTADDRRRMWRFRNVDTIADRFGVLRHIMRYLQWDQGIMATRVEEHILDLVDHQPTRFPAITWLFSYFDLFPSVWMGWQQFYSEVITLLEEDFGQDQSDSALTTVLDLQLALMPAPGRQFPETIHLAHDYVSYYRSATKGLYASGKAGTPDMPLSGYPSVPFTVAGDPMGLCTVGLHPSGDARSETMQGDFHVGATSSNELDSPLMRPLPALAHYDIDTVPDWIDLADLAVYERIDDSMEPEVASEATVAVTISRP